MQVLIFGAAGMIGRKLTDRLVEDGSLAGRKIEKLWLHDVVEPPMPQTTDIEIDARSGDICEPGAVERLVAKKPDVIYHLAAIVSGEAETDFEKGYRVNLDATRKLFEAIRGIENYRPRVIFTSSLAVFGAPFPSVIPDEFHLTPLTSYGVQKACGEMLLADYSRRGILDGIGIRLPTISVRPGKPNKAASSFFSGIIREPLAGQEAILPVSEDVVHWVASPRAAVGYLVHAAGVPGEKIGPRRNMTMPGLGLSVAEMIAALRDVAGDKVAARIREERDPFIEGIVVGWPTRFDAARARELGFVGDKDFQSVIRAHIEDELGGEVA
ncbi:D-erythronate dehydrogenase [Tepidamorphus sp. 3E244]|uniref:D-erythronate dehydrogenase n=1 Tax=Tepidamorphus sp. 3E244 TaxID=3385498 RepID=UPI0038FC29F9